MKAKMSSLQSIPSSPPPKPPLTPPLQITTTKKWIPINLTQSELSLPLTFPTGQTFLWKQTGPNQFTGPVGPHLISLSHRPSSLSFLLHNSSAAAETALLDFVNSKISLRRISASNPNFAAIDAGVRVLRQSPVECLIQFLCSSNNNIARITSMVAFLSSLGDRLGSVAGVEFHQFPSLDRLAVLSERNLRDAGFGYRAKYIVGTVAELRSKPGGGEAWLLSLRELELRSVMEELCSLPGVGPKVAACVALFSLDQHRAVPVDTHVWKIGTRDLLPELAGAKPTPKLCSRVAEAFVEKYGEYAGWAQAQLFVAELPAQKREKEKNEKKRKSVKRKIVETDIQDDDL